MSQKLPTFNFEWIEDNSQFNEVFIKHYDEKKRSSLNSWGWCSIPKKFYELHRDLPFLSEKVEKLLTSLEDENEYVVLIKRLKQALNHGLILQKINRVISFNRDEWLKPYIEMNTELKQNAKYSFEKDFFKTNK